ncbi:polysaccharide biosynthesis tyrosine autokinase [bacterium]|nr:polysaccharide biosynthesis tyrosine autokinase [bacterium]
MENQTNGTRNGASNGHYTPHDRSGYMPERQMTLHDSLAIIYRNRWWILGIFALTVSAVGYVTFTMAPTYEAATIIMIDEKQGVGQSLFDPTGLGQQRTLINNHVQILKSRYLAHALVDRLWRSPQRDSLQLFIGPEDKVLTESQLRLRAIVKIRKAISVSPVRDTDLIEIKMHAGSPFEAAFLANSFVETYEELDRDFSRGEIKQIVEFLEEQLGRKEGDLKGSEEQLKTFLEKEKIASLTDEATQVVEKGAEFESLYKGALIELQVSEERLKHLKGQLGKSKANLESEIARVSSPLVLRLRDEMAEIERTIAVLRAQGVDESHPDVSKQRGRLQAIKGRLTEETRKLIVDGLPPGDPLTKAQDLVVKILEIETEIFAVKAQANAYKKVVESYTDKLEALPDKNVQLARLERNRKVDENLYMMMREKYEESRITQAGEIGVVRIIDSALPPGSPISPKKPRNMILGVLVGLGLGIGFTFLRDYLDTSVRRVEDIEAMGLPVLGAIPSIEPLSVNGGPKLSNEKNGHARLDKSQEAHRRLVTHFKPKSPISESYRTLRTNLQFSKPDKRPRTILVTSAGPGEGKSTTTANLAIAMSQQGVRTLLVDTDLRRPVQHRLFNLDKGRGLSNVLVGKKGLTQVIQHTDVENLDMITCGILPPNPAEMLGSGRMKELLEEIGQLYDVCLLDSPPLIAVTDAAVLSNSVDGVLLVVKSGKTHREALNRGVELLENVKSPILGVLLNDISRANTYGSYYYYYYYHYYYYYGETGDKKRRKKGRHAKSRTEVA